jgi:hypothetical protein
LRVESLDQIETSVLKVLRRYGGLTAGNEYLEALWLLGDEAGVSKYISWYSFRLGLPVLAQMLLASRGATAQVLDREEAQKQYAAMHAS